MIFEVGFFSSNNPAPGPIRGYLEPFLILATFHRVIKILKRFPGIWDARELRIFGVPDTRESRIPGVWDNGDLFFILFFKLHAKLPSSGTPESQESLVSQTPGSPF